MPVKALGENYFNENVFPLSIRRINRMEAISHEDDLTEIEHYHDFNEVVFIVKGKGTQVIEDQEYPVSAGDVFVLQGNQKHFFKDAQGIEILNVMYRDDKKSPLLSEGIKQLEGYKALFILESQYRAWYYFKNKLHLVRNDMAKIEILLNSMILEQYNGLEGYQFILKNRFEELIVLLSRYYSQLDATEAKALVRIAKIIDYLEKNFAEKVYFEHLAEIAFMSMRNFQRIFKKAVGSSPSNYLMQIRLQKARKLLRHSNLSISEIAFNSGFADANYFIKCFKKENGITPAKFRINHS